MNWGAKGLTSIISVMALLVMLATSVMAPELLAAPKKKPPTDDTAFTITTEEDIYQYWPPLPAGSPVVYYTEGTFSIEGAIEDAGSASRWWDYITNGSLELVGQNGTMQIRIIPGSGKPAKDTFEIVGGTGAYEALVGVTGSYRERTGRPKADGSIGTIRRTLEGSAPE